MQRLGEGRLHELEAGLRMGTKRIHVWRDGGMGTRRRTSSVRGIGGYNYGGIYINVGIGGFINVRMGIYKCRYRGIYKCPYGGICIGRFINAGIG